MLSAALRPLVSTENFQVFAEYFHFKFSLKGRSRAGQSFKLLQPAVRGWFRRKKSQMHKSFQERIASVSNNGISFGWWWQNWKTFLIFLPSFLHTPHFWSCDKGSPRAMSKPGKGPCFIYHRKAKFCQFTGGHALAWAVDRCCLRHSSPLPLSPEWG